jgi:uracil-DNA glycosylase
MPAHPVPFGGDPNVPDTVGTAAPRPLETVAKEAASCVRCPLSEGRTNVVFGAGKPSADLVVVATAPGRHEDLSGRPFVGAAGNLLDNLLGDNDLSRDDIYVTTIVKCRPPNGRRPEQEEIETCAPYLAEQLATIRPRVILALGPAPTRLLLRRDLPVARIAGYRLPFQGATLIVTHDPDDALRGSSPAMKALQRDVRTAKGVADGSIPPADESLAELLSPRRRRGRTGRS